METFKTLTHEDDIKLTPLFDKPVSGTDERLRRLEDAVQGMHNDFDTIMPTMVRMVSMEQSLKDLINQLRTLTGDDSNAMLPDDQNGSMMGPVQPEKEKAGPPVDHTLPAAVAAAVTPPETAPPVTAPPVTAPTTAPPDKAPEADSKPLALAPGTEKTETPVAAQPVPSASAPEKAAVPEAKATSGTLQGVRIADHGAQTRIVVDMSGKASLPATLDNGGKRLVIDPAGMAWAGQTQQALKNSKLVSAYAFTDGKLVVELRQPVKIVKQNMLAPGGGAGYRTMIDLAPAS